MLERVNETEITTASHSKNGTTVFEITTPAGSINKTKVVEKNAALIGVACIAMMETTNKLLDIYSKNKEERKKMAEEKREQCCKFQKYKIENETCASCDERYTSENLKSLEKYCENYIYFKGTCSLSVRFMSNYFILIFALILNKLFPLY
jgi:hypothetical protein